MTHKTKDTKPKIKQEENKTTEENDNWITDTV